jgi:uncharacterized lipoprotein YehR (DUF1307 family)
MLSIGNIEAQIDYINMKTFRFIGMALIAIVMCVNFTSCSDDDNEDSNVSKLIGTWYEVNSEEEQICFTFNSDGSAYTWVNTYGEPQEKYKISWSATETQITIVYGGKDGTETDNYSFDKTGNLVLGDYLFSRNK